MALNNSPSTQLVKTDEFDCYEQKFKTKFKFDQGGKNSFFCCSPSGEIFSSENKVGVMTLYLMTRSSFENQERNLELKKIPLLQWSIQSTECPT